MKKKMLNVNRSKFKASCLSFGKSLSQICKHVNKKSASQCSKESTPQFFALFRGIKEKCSNMCYEIQKLRVEIVETNSLILLLIAIKAVRKVVTSNHDDGTKWHHPIIFVWRKKIIIILCCCCCCCFSLEFTLAWLR